MPRIDLGAMLMRLLELNLPLIKSGGLLQVEISPNWSMCSQVLDDERTGKAIVHCTYPEALDKFTELATAAGHTVEPADSPETVIVTPAQN